MPISLFLHPHRRHTHQSHKRDYEHKSLLKHKNGIYECHHIGDIKKYTSPRTIIMIDYDNTIARPELAKDNGSEQWFVSFFSALCDALKDNEKALSMTLTVYDEIQKLVNVKPVEDMVVDLLHQLRDMGIPVYIITSRGYPRIPFTERQLKEDLGITLPHQKHYKDKAAKIDKTDEIHFLPQKPGSKKRPSYKGHVIYCDGEEKAYCAEEFLVARKKVKKIHQAERILLIDDSKRHLEPMVDTFKHGYEITCLHYVHTHERMKRFNKHVAGEHLARHLYPFFSPPAQKIVEEHYSKLGIDPVLLTI